MTQPTATLERALVDVWSMADWRDVHVVLAVSGGPDSVAMLRATVAAKANAGGKGRVFAAYLNHGIRPAEAVADEAWLGELCGRFNIPLEIGCRDVPRLAQEAGDGLEAAARTARYQFLLNTAERLGARFVAVAHTADDQVETVLHRLIRGTGVAGLAGMPRTRPLSPTVSLVRPLLGTRREDVLAYLADIGQDYRIDATNADARFTRNRVRHELLPLLRAGFNADVDQAILRLAGQADETQRLLATLASELVGRCATLSPNSIQIDCQTLAAEPTLLVRETCKATWTAAGWPLQNMGFDEWQQLAAMIYGTGASNSLNLPAAVRAERRGEHLYLARLP